MSTVPAAAPAPAASPAPEESGTSSAPVEASEPAANTQACPHCGAVNAADNLFCEVCGFDFTTGVMPRVEGGEPTYLPPVTPLAAPSSPEPAAPSASLDSPEPSGGDTADSPSDPGDPDPRPGPPASPARPQGRPADVGAEGSAAADIDPAGAEVEAPAEDPAPGASPAAHRAATPAEAPARPASTPSPSTPAAGTDDAPSLPSTKPVNRPPSRHVAGDWVVEVWIDPDWFEVQDSGEEFPSVAPPEVVPLTGSDALVGRRSRSSVPDVDCGLDSAVSRRHALLTSDGRRWWVEDLDSSNGTWVGPAIGPLPDHPITGRVEVDADDRIYVGAWTRLVVRPAVESEVER